MNIQQQDLFTAEEKSNDIDWLHFFPPHLQFGIPKSIARNLKAIKKYHTGELILQGRANDSNLPSTFISYNKLPTLPTVPWLILEQIDSKDKLLSHPFKAWCNCSPLLWDGRSHLFLHVLVLLCIWCSGESHSDIFYAPFNRHSR